MSMTAVAISISFVRAPTAARSENGEPLTCEVIHAEVRAVQAQFLGGYCQFDRLQKGVGRGAHLGMVPPASSGRRTEIRSSSTQGTSRDGRINTRDWPHRP